MKWPDPKCAGPHKRGRRFEKWQHTDACKAAASNKALRSGEMPEIPDVDEKIENVVERGRLAGAL